MQSFHGHENGKSKVEKYPKTSQYSRSREVKYMHSGSSEFLPGAAARPSKHRGDWGGGARRCAARDSSHAKIKCIP